MTWSIRILALVGLVVLGTGMFFAFVVSALLCFDVCAPDLPAQAVRSGAIFLGPGLAITAAAWVVSLVAEARAGGRRWLLGIALSLPAIVVAMVLVLLVGNGGSLLPASQAGLSQWLRAWIDTLPLLLIWPLVIVVYGFAGLGKRAHV